MMKLLITLALAMGALVIGGAQRASRNDLPDVYHTGNPEMDRQAEARWLNAYPNEPTTAQLNDSPSKS